MESTTYRPKSRHRLLRWLVIFVGVWVALAVLQVSALAYPQPWFEYHAEVEPFDLYSDRAFTDDDLAALAELPDMLAAAGMHSPAIDHDVFICHDLWRFDLFRRLSLQRGDLLGFELSVLDNAYINVSKVDRLAEAFDGYINHTALEGDLSQVIAHEIAHGWLQETVGLWRLQETPFWKNEGFAEYASNVYRIRSDSAATLTRRLHELQDNLYWGYDWPHARWRYKAQLTIEYLLEIERMSIVEIFDDPITLDQGYERLQKWAETN